jgi:hypothetical protein
MTVVGIFHSYFPINLEQFPDLFFLSSCGKTRSKAVFVAFLQLEKRTGKKS